MGVVKAPLLSLDAKNSFGDLFTFLKIRGQNIVRQKVVPSNPNTALQQVVRNRMSDAVDCYHTQGFTDADISAFNRLASVTDPTFSGYNKLTSLFLKADKLGYNLNFPFECVVDDTSATHLIIDFKGPSAGLSYTGHIGTTKTSQLTEVACNDSGGGIYDVDFSGLTPGVTYYMYISEDATDKLTRTGLFAAICP